MESNIRSPSQMIHSQLDALQREYIRQMPERIRQLEIRFRQCLSDNQDRLAFTSLYRDVHAFAGSGTTFGFPLVTQCGEELETIVQQQLQAQQQSQGQQESVIVQNRERIYLLLESLRNAAQQACSIALQLPTLVYLKQESKSADPAPMDELELHLSQAGYQVRTLLRLNQLSQVVQEVSPLAILIDIPDQGQDVFEYVTMMQKRHTRKIPVLFMATSDMLESRLHAVRAGGVSYLVRPFDRDRLLTQLSMLAWSPVRDTPHVLIVEDDPLLSSHYSLTLQQAGILSVTLEEPQQILERLADCGPDMILLDVYLPGCDAAELVQVIRQQDEWVGIPTVFLSTQAHIGRRWELISAGVDDFLQKPISSESLVRCVSSWIDRSHRFRSVMTRDSLTGLLNHGQLKERLSTELIRARRQNTTLAYAMLDLDGLKQINDMYGHLVGDRVLKSFAHQLQVRLRQTDILGRYGGDEFGVILPETTRAGALQVLDEICFSFAQVQHDIGMQHAVATPTIATTVSAGIASYPQYQEATLLIQAADRALYQAKAQGKNCVVLTDEPEPSSESTHN